MRATASAVLVFMMNMIGLGLGPLCIGIMSDIFNAHSNLGSGGSLRAALIISTCIGVPGAVLYYLTRKTVKTDAVS
jgi:hypothetical protein